MPFFPAQFEVGTPAQTGGIAGTDVMGSLLKGLQMAYANPMMQQQLAQQQQKTLQSQLQNQWYPAKTQAGINATQSTANLQNQTANYIPQNTGANIMNAIANLGGDKALSALLWLNDNGKSAFNNWLKSATNDFNNFQFSGSPSNSSNPSGGNGSGNPPSSSNTYPPSNTGSPQNTPHSSGNNESSSLSDQQIKEMPYTIDKQTGIKYHYNPTTGQVYWKNK